MHGFFPWGWGRSSYWQAKSWNCLKLTIICHIAFPWKLQAFNWLHSSKVVTSHRFFQCNCLGGGIYNITDFEISLDRLSPFSFQHTQGSGIHICIMPLKQGSFSYANWKSPNYHFHSLDFSLFCPHSPLRDPVFPLIISNPQVSKRQ